MIKLTDLYHHFIEEKKDIKIAVDMTCGQGYDSLFLSKRCQTLYVFDIQEDAIKLTKDRLVDQNNVIYIHDSHDKLDLYVKEAIDLIVFNLGYLPGSDKTIKTSAHTTRIALKKSCQKLNFGGLIILELYPHNPQEREAVMAFTKILEPPFDVIEVNLHNKLNAPNLIIIKKSAI